MSPILYEVAPGSQDHTVLHKTLKHWADTHKDGALGKERIVVEYAMAKPLTSPAKTTLLVECFGR